MLTLAVENKPSDDALGQGKTPVHLRAQGIPAGYEVHTRAVKLQQEHPSLDYREAVGAVLSEDAQLKARYAGVQR